jgi:regulator of cell morphogenesis and NO signaling
VLIINELSKKERVRFAKNRTCFLTHNFFVPLPHKTNNYNIMHNLYKYQPTDSMSGLIADNYKILLVLLRFGIPLGVGDDSIGEVCRKNNIDVETFLVVVNMFLNYGQPDYVVSPENIDVPTVVAYLKNGHEYFLKFCFPSIRAQLSQVLTSEPHELSHVMLRYFDEYADEVSRHMMYEEKEVFPYIDALLCGKRDLIYNIGIFGKRHNRIEERLTEFKNISIKYYSARITNELNRVLFDIFTCESDLASHNDIENRVLIPIIAQWEKRNKINV